MNQAADKVAQIRKWLDAQPSNGRMHDHQGIIWIPYDDVPGLLRKYSQSQLSASEERVRELEACLVGAIKCSTCEGSGQWEPPCSGCEEGYPVPHDYWCKTTEDCPECGGSGMSLPDEAVLNKCIALLPSPPQVAQEKP